MADPNEYRRTTSFRDYQANQPTTPLPGGSVDTELDNAALSISELIAALGDIRRSDGQLQNGIVTADALADGVVAALAPVIASYVQTAIDAAARAEAAADRAEAAE